MSLQHQFNDFRNNLRHVSREDREECPCSGHGWIMSDFDTWHECPVHFQGQRHPASCELAFADVVEVFKVVDNGVEPVFQVQMTIGHEHADREEVFIHFHEFSTEAEARKFGERIARRADISSRVQNDEYWLHFTRPPRREDLL